MNDSKVKDQLTKIFKVKAYWEKERNKCLDKMANSLHWLFFANFHLIFSGSLEKWAKQIREEGLTSFVGIINSLLLIAFFIISCYYLFQIGFTQFRIRKCSQKLEEINSKYLKILLEKLTNQENGN